MNPIAYLFTKRIRGFRVAELAAFGCLSALVLTVYFSKAHAGGETARIDDVEQQITDEQHRVRLLGAELAHLEAPERIERLSQQYLGLAPIDAKHETAPDSLMEIARQAATPPAAATKTAAKPAAKPAAATGVVRASLAAPVVAPAATAPAATAPAASVPAPATSQEVVR